MRKITIDFTKDPVEISNHILGKQGEHNATELIITPPAKMSENEKIKSYSVAFQIGAYKVHHSAIYEKAESITVPVEKKVSKSNVISLQLEGYDGEENLLVKSERIDNLIFEASVVGEEDESEEKSELIEQIAKMKENMAAEVTANTNFRKEFGEDETGNLTYKGLPVSGDNYKTAILYLGEFGLNSSAYGTEILDYMNLFPVGAIIKTIRVEYAGKMIDIKNLTAIDSVPYILHMGQVYLSPITSFPVLAFIGNYTTVSSGNYLIAQSFIISAIENYEVPKIEIDYYE